jgi:hypothetical protein
MAVKQVYNNFFIGTLVEMSATTMNTGCVYLASDTKELYGVDIGLNTFLIGGDGSLDKNWIHDEPSPASVWNISHPLGKFPSITVIDNTNTIIEGSPQYVDDYNIIITFNQTFSGKAILN